MADFLSQEEIDALLNGRLEPPAGEATLTDLEKDTLGEIGNISMGSAATALSQILNKRVLITTPSIAIMTPAELLANFQVPYILVEVNFTEGLEGSNLLMIKVSDAAVIADLMMGGSGRDVQPELDEIKSSAVAEAMNQMIGSAATSMATIFQRNVKISPPRLTAVRFGNESYTFPWPEDQEIAVVYFKMEIEDLIDSQIMQVMPVEVAKAEVAMLMNPQAPEAGAALEDTPPAWETMPGNHTTDRAAVSVTMTATPAAEKPGTGATFVPPAAPVPPAQSPNERRGQVYGTPARNIDLILDVPLDVEVILGTAMKRIRDILNLAPGAIVELDRLVEEPVQITVNGTPIARGEVVVVNENFGVRITHIMEPYERINHLRQ
ncbi:Surface presentation of antigen (SpoA) [Moorella glycerini]|uniref:Flagellar motor switch protein FliN n=1 Tax=Neomoorella stamsii TaxID=1266720 RepID=A0A9X7J266_9FIRM|nr:MULTISPECIES: flagellar motor switch phosphatase FliY [Moorella]PRR72259.1 Flagellar motor switch protein FliN [Moorella stamsii]CEP69560.1 Surface presentation of antigen (SpoA) [Moorella glycerini]